MYRQLYRSMWTLTSPDGSRVERYIVEFECRVRNITFVEKYMSVSASGGTGRVATSVSCFGGLGQLYRVKVWAVSGPNISQQPAVKCLTPDGQSVDQATVSKHCIGLHIRWAVQKGRWKGYDYMALYCKCVYIGQHGQHFP